ncbi:MAG: hypothetical protein HC915_20385 [Anaerolineae bacterium]|nr:hypothetical protein [Anaerolineae bacterium]
MATIAIIQNFFPALNETDPVRLSGLSRQVYDRFIEVLEEESGHHLQRAPSLEGYLAAEWPMPTLAICAPLPEIGNLAPGLAELQRIREALRGVPLVVWSTRDEQSVRETVLKDYGVARYYTGTVLQAPDDIADMVLEYL